MSWDTDFYSINGIEQFKDVLKKITLNESLEDAEKTYILTCALIFLKCYEEDRRKIKFLEFSYYLILKYSIIHGDYKPLYDFSVDFGFYPISKFILEKWLLDNVGINDYLLGFALDKFHNWGYTETLEQSITKKLFLNDDSNGLSFIAPTSYWKSSAIIDFLRENSSSTRYKRVGIIVPSKSLLIQTYKLVKQNELGKKILIHDEMYTWEDSFIAVFTQERALRLIKKHPEVSFDALFIDEAHNLLEKDSRSILLSRLISRNLKVNSNAKIVYLSPLVSDPNNLKVANQGDIHTHRIVFNIKEPEIFEYKKDGDIIKHNRFVVYDKMKGYKIWNDTSDIGYIVSNSGSKNFLYHRKPRTIEQMARDLYEFLENERNTEVALEISSSVGNLIDTLEEEVHGKFYGINLLRHGIVYLHWKIPDLVKEYLEFKFKEIPELKYVVANTVILEWINLPVDSLFITHTHWLKWKELINLIWRVNRLNTVFESQSTALNKLLPKVHFVHSRYEATNCKSQFAKIKLLKSSVIPDEVDNPILRNFDINSIKDQKTKEKLKRIQEYEAFLGFDSTDGRDKLRKYLIENWINEFYYPDSFEKAIDAIQSNMESLANSGEWVLEKINSIFLRSCWEEESDWEFRSCLKDKEIGRLSREAAREYYDYYINVSLRQSLKTCINATFDYFKGKSVSEKETERKFYFWDSYGEVVYDSVNYPNSKNRVYIDVRWKDDDTLINLAIVKIKLEEDFIGFKLNKLIVFLYDYHFITEAEYNSYVYGTSDQKIIAYINKWLSPSISKRLEEAWQLGNIMIDENGNLKGNDDFIEYKSSINDFYRFELERFIQ